MLAEDGNLHAMVQCKCATEAKAKRLDLAFRSVALICVEPLNEWFRRRRKSWDLEFVELVHKLPMRGHQSQTHTPRAESLRPTD